MGKKGASEHIRKQGGGCSKPGHQNKSPRRDLGKPLINL